MKSIQIYAIAIACVVTAAAVCTYIVLSDDDEVPGSILTDAAGNQIQIPDSIGSITAASPSIADIVCYMGYGSKIVAVSTSCTHPNIPSGTPTVGSYTSPSTDGISTANADVTFIDGSNTNAVNAYNTLRDAGMRVIMMFGSRDTADGIYKNVEIIGKVMKDASWEGIVTDLKAEVALLKDITKSAPTTRILLSTGLGNLTTDSSGNFTDLTGFTGAGVYLAGIDSAQMSMISGVSKMTTPVSGSGWVSADTDFISTSTGNVDMLIVLWTNKPAMPNSTAIADLIVKMKSMSSWGNCGAVKNGNIVFIGGDAGSDLSRVTPYTVYNGLTLMSLYINPGSYSLTAGGTALKLSDLPQCVESSSVLATLVGYTKNKAA